jgi:hypothetical protein
MELLSEHPLADYVTQFMMHHLASNVLQVHNHPGLLESLRLLFHPEKVCFANKLALGFLLCPDVYTGNEWYDEDTEVEEGFISATSAFTLILAVQFGLLVIVQWLLSFKMIRSEIDISISFELYESIGSPLVEASFRGHHDIVNVLLLEGANVNVESAGYHAFALQAACFRGHDTVIRMLLGAGADVNAIGGMCSCTLQAASREGHEQTVQILLDTGADTDSIGGFYSSPIHAAIYGKKQVILRMLIAAGANVNARVPKVGKWANAGMSVERNGVRFHQSPLSLTMWGGDKDII